MVNLQETEEKLIDLLAQDKHNWVQIYRLMDRVDKEKAYKETANSFTQWVNNLADKAKVHVSLLWARKKAGQAYDQFIQRAEKKGLEVPSLEEANVSPDNINLATKIAGKNENVADELLQKVAKNELHRQDLKNAWAEVKQDRIAHGYNPTRTSRHSDDTEKSLSLTKAISLAFVNNAEWLDVHKKAENQHEKELYKTFFELPVRTGTSRNARRIDVAVIENLTNNQHSGNHGLTLHAIEVKISKEDLLKDSKMQEYTDYCNFFWLAIPEELLEEAESYVSNDWGIIVYDQKKGVLKAVRKASELNATMRESALEEMLKRTI